jgi:integrase
MPDHLPAPTNTVPASPSGSLSLSVSAKQFALASRSESTRQAYASDWSQFVEWCAQEGVESLPASPTTVCNWIAHLATTYKVASISRKVAAVGAAHRTAGLDSPTTSEAVKLTMAGVRRTLGVRQHQARPLSVTDLKRIVAALSDDLAGLRDRAVLLTAFSAALRRSEVAALQVEDITFVDDGMVVLIKKSKGDQEAQGREVAVPLGSSKLTCAVTALQTWLEVSGIESGALFPAIDRHGNLSAQALTGHSIGLIVKRSAESAGMDPDLVSGHSLRAGLVTAAAEGGANEVAIMQTTGHKSSAMVRKYIRRVEAFKNNAAAAAGL